MMPSTFPAAYLVERQEVERAGKIKIIFMAVPENPGGSRHLSSNGILASRGYSALVQGPTALLLQPPAPSHRAWSAMLTFRQLLTTAEGGP